MAGGGGGGDMAHPLHVLVGGGCLWVGAAGAGKHILMVGSAAVQGSL